MESLGEKLDSKLDKINVDRLVTSDMKHLNEKNVHNKYNNAKLIIRILALLSELSLVLSFVSCGSNKYTGINIISRAINLEFYNWKQWGQVALVVTSILCIAVIVISLFDSNKIFHKILSITSAEFLTGLVALVFYSVEGQYKVLYGFYVLVMIYGGMFLISIRGKACELKLLGEEGQNGNIAVLSSLDWNNMFLLCIGQVVTNIIMCMFSSKVMNDDDLVLVTVLVLGWSIITLIFVMMKSRRSELCFKIQAISCMFMMIIGMGFCINYSVTLIYLVNIMLWIGCLLASPYRKLKIPVLSEVKIDKDKIKNDSVKIIRDVQNNIQNIDVSELKSGIPSSYKVVKQMVKKGVEKGANEEEVELEDKLKGLLKKVKPIFKNKIALIALGAIIVTISLGSIVFHHNKLEKIYTVNNNRYLTYNTRSYKIAEEIDEQYAGLFNGLDRIEELREAKSSLKEILDGDTQALKRLEMEYGKDSMEFEIAYMLGYEKSYDKWASALVELYNASEEYYNRKGELEETRRTLSEMKRELYEIRDNVKPYKDNVEFYFSSLLSSTNQAIEKNEVDPCINKIDKCLKVCEQFDYLVAERYAGYK